jgi:hypothetical protein
MEQTSLEICELESRDQRSSAQEQQLQELLLCRSNLLDTLQAQSAAAAAPFTQPTRNVP